MIFLDIDGVLNNYRFLEQNSGLKPEEQVFIDDENLKPATREARMATEALGRSGLKLSGKTDDSISKAASIRLSDHGSEVKNYVILDDDFLDVPESNFEKPVLPWADGQNCR